MEVRFGQHGFRVYVYDFNWLKWLFALYVVVYWRGETTLLLNKYTASLERCSFPVVVASDQWSSSRWLLDLLVRLYVYLIKGVVDFLAFLRWTWRSRSLSRS